MADRGVTGVPRLLVKQAQIARVVTVFYAGVREHPQLGPIFDAHVTDWPAHQEKIVRCKIQRFSIMIVFSNIKGKAVYYSSIE